MSEENPEGNKGAQQEATQNVNDAQNEAKVGPDQLQAALADAEKWRNDFLYLKADFENYKRSAIRERSDYLKYGSERVFVEILEVMDNFERALEYEVKPENLENFVKGVRLIRDELKTLVARFQVQELPALGQKFDPNFHEAIGTEPSDNVPPGQITKVFKKPYKLHDRVIRPAQVIISDSPKT